MRPIYVIAAGIVGFGLGGIVDRLVAAPKIEYVQVQTGDVPDLIHRLKAVTKERYSYVGGTDVRVCFEGDAAVELQLNMKNDNQYTSKAPTLRAAVAGITSPSEEIKTVLQGWAQ